MSTPCLDDSQRTDFTLSKAFSNICAVYSMATTLRGAYQPRHWILDCSGGPQEARSEMMQSATLASSCRAGPGSVGGARFTTECAISARRHLLRPSGLI